MSTRSLGSLTLDLILKTGSLSSGMSKASRQVENESRKIRRSLESNVSRGAESATDSLNRFGAQVVSIAAAWRGLSSAISSADTWTNLNNRLRLVTDGQAEFVAAQENVLRIAKDSRQPLEATAELYQRIAQNQDELGLSGQGVADIVETISKAMVVSGTSAQGAQAALVQLGQAFASGVLRGEELNSVLEQAPALAKAVADGLGVPIGKLRELGKAGELTAGQVIGALQNQADEIDSAFSTMDATVSQSLTNVRTNLTELIGRFSEATGASAGLAAAIGALGNNIPQVATAFAAFASVKITKQLADRVRVFRETQAQLIAQTKVELANAQAIELKARAAVLDTQAEVRRAAVIGGSVSISSKAAQATLAHRQAIIALEAAQTRAAVAANVLGRAAGGVLAFFGGPVGLAFMVATTAASWLLFRDNTQKAEQALIDFNGTIDQSITKFQELNRAQQAGEILRLTDEIDAGVKSLSDSISLLSNEADFTDLYDTFGESLQSLQREFNSGAIGADEFANSVLDLGNQLAGTGQIEEVQRRGIIKYAAEIGNAAREVEKKNGVLDLFIGKQNEAANATDGNTQAIHDQAAALAAGQKSLSDYIGKMDQVINQGVVSLVRKTRGEFAALNVEVGQMINAAGGVDALDPKQRSAINEFLATRKEQIRLEEQYDAAKKKARGRSTGKSQEEKDAERILESYKQMAAGIAERIALFGTEGEAARIRYQIEIDDLSELTAAQKRLAEARQQEALAGAERYDLMVNERKETERRAEAESRLWDRFEDTIGAIKDEREALGMSSDQFEIWNRLRWLGKDATDEMRQSVIDNTRALQEERRAMEDQIEIMDGARYGAREFFDSMKEGEGILKSLEDAFGRFADALFDWATNGLIDQFFGKQGTSGQGTAGGGWLSALFGSSGSSQGSIFDLFSGSWGFAGGGTMAPYSVARVNELGMEMATVGGNDYLLTGSRPVEITPHHKLNRGGASVTQNFYNPVMSNAKTQFQIAQEQAVKAQRAMARS